VKKNKESFRTYVCFLFSIIALSMSSSLVNAYSKDNHEFITRQAVDLLEACKIRDIKEDYVESMVRYNIGQDELTRKLLIWHFPAAAKGEEYRSPLATFSLVSSFALDTNFEIWTTYLAKELNRSHATWTTYPALGALLHYVQDVSVPAHAIPIFHPSSYFPPQTDGFDNWSRFSGFSELSEACDNIKGFKSVEKLLKDARSNTLTNIQKPKAFKYLIDGVSTDGSWIMLWPVKFPDRWINDGFSRYGCSGDSFGDAEIDCNDQIIQVPLSSYVSIASTQVKDAIYNSAKLIYSFTSKIHAPDCHGNQCADAEDGDKRWLPNTKKLKEELGITY